MKVAFADGRAILDREALHAAFKKSGITHGERTIRKHCAVVGHSDEGRALYDMEACIEVLSHVKTRRTRTVLEQSQSLCQACGDLVCPHHGNVPASAPTDRGHGPTLKESNMQDPTVSTRCTVQKPNGSFCDVRSASGMPFPICLHHAHKLFEYMQPEVPPVETAEELWEMFQQQREARRPLYDAERAEIDHLRGQQSQVYYLRLPGDLIKIGVTVNLKQRLTALRIPDWDVLATEPGMQDAESQRHKQFAHLRQGRMENFTAAPELLELIGNLRHQFGPPKITTYPERAYIDAQRLNAAS